MPKLADMRGIPKRPFFFTLDQVAGMLSLDVRTFAKSYVWKTGEDVGAWKPRFVRAVDIRPDEFAGARREGADNHEWRIGEAELLRWLTYTGLYIYDPYLDESTDSLAPKRSVMEQSNTDKPDPDLLDL